MVFATKAKVGDIKKLREIKGVKSVTLAKVYFAADTSANNMANVSTVWSNYQYKGEGTVVSIIDTGIDPNHKDLRLSNESKAKLTAKDIDGFTENSGYGRYFTSKVPFGHNYSDNNDIITMMIQKNNTVCMLRVSLVQMVPELIQQLQ